MRYRMILGHGGLHVAVCTITEELYLEGAYGATRHGNGTVKTLYVSEGVVYDYIRSQAKKHWGEV